MTHFSWPKLGEKIKHKTIEGTVVSLSQEDRSFRVHDNFGEYFQIKLEDLILEEIRNKS